MGRDRERAVGGGWERKREGVGGDGGERGGRRGMGRGRGRRGG